VSSPPDCWPPARPGSARALHPIRASAPAPPGVDWFGPAPPQCCMPAHEQSVRALHLLAPPIASRTLCISHAMQRWDLRIAPSVILDQLSAVRKERCKFGSRELIVPLSISLARGRRARVQRPVSQPASLNRTNFRDRLQCRTLGTRVGAHPSCCRFQARKKSRRRCRSSAPPPLERRSGTRVRPRPCTKHFRIELTAHGSSRIPSRTPSSASQAWSTALCSKGYLLEECSWPHPWYRCRPTARTAPAPSSWRGEPAMIRRSLSGSAEPPQTLTSAIGAAIPVRSPASFRRRRQ